MAITTHLTAQAYAPDLGNLIHHFNEGPPTAQQYMYLRRGESYQETPFKTTIQRIMYTLTATEGHLLQVVHLLNHHLMTNSSNSIGVT